jgi:hypothetical protein
MRKVAIFLFMSAMTALLSGVLGAAGLIQFNTVGAILLYLLLKEASELTMAYAHANEE